jgi:hypothetical protein
MGTKVLRQNRKELGLLASKRGAESGFLVREVVAMRKVLDGLMITLIASISIPAGSAETWYVDDSVSASGNGKSLLTAFKRVQEGIDAASEGDTVLVVEGTYYENVEFRGPNIVLTSKNPEDSSIRNATIIDGNHAGTVVQFSGEEDETCVVTGFTIRNGDNPFGGGGISVGSGSPATRATIEKNLITGNQGVYGAGVFGCAGVVQDNFIIGNSASYYGGGLCSCSGTIQDNTISGNSAAGGGGLAWCDGAIKRNAIANNGALAGGGLLVCDGDIVSNEIRWNTAAEGGGLKACNGRISGNLISENRAQGDDAEGGGLSECGGTIIWNTVEGNSSDGPGGGLYGCHGDIQRNTFRKNLSKDRGGGLAVCHGTIEANRVLENSAEHGGGLHNCDGAVRSNLIAGNVASGDPASGGGGLLLCDGTIENNTIVGNAARRGGGLFVCNAVIRNCVLWANSAPDFGPQLYLCSTPSYSCIQNWTGGGLANTAVNPVFVDADGRDNDPHTYDDNDYQLQPYMQASVCIDKGENQPWMQGATDRDGNPRIYYGLSSNTVDMGAYEYGSWPFKVVRIRKGAEGETELTWYSRPGDTYVVWSRPVMYVPPPIYIAWAKRATLSSQGAITSWTDSAMPYDRFFYRVELEW